MKTKYRRFEEFGEIKIEIQKHLPCGKVALVQKTIPKLWVMDDYRGERDAIACHIRKARREMSRFLEAYKNDN